MVPGAGNRVCLLLLASALTLSAGCNDSNQQGSKHGGKQARGQLPKAPPPPPSGPGARGAWKCGDGQCDYKMGEDCMVCAKDCKECNGCQRKIGSGCTNCKCEQCVCKKLPDCCTPKGKWDKRCVDACKNDCGGCGLVPGRGPSGSGKPGLPKGMGKGTPKGAPKGAPGGGKLSPSNWRCGDGKCEVKDGEDCAICPKDCKTCDGCQVKVGWNCINCKCEKCVCKKLPGCCKKGGRWGADCVKACKEQCGGCGLTAAPPASGKASTGPAPPTATKKTMAVPAQCGNNKCELALGEDCEICPRDCSRCNGCLPKLGPRCHGCRCEACVCKAVPECCKKGGRWSIRCVEACRDKCGGCGISDAGVARPPVHGKAAPPPVPGKGAPPTVKGAPTVKASAGAAGSCGDGKCDPTSEDCILCARDCGNCNGCQAKIGPGCLRCKCEKCVCKKLPSCCAASGQWDQKCVNACKTQCGGCGLSRK